MNPLRRLKRWWQLRTGKAETPFDGDGPYWVFSMVFHLGLLALISVLAFETPLEKLAMEVFSLPEVEEELEQVPEEFYFSNRIPDEMGAHSEHGETMAMSQAATLDFLSEIPTPSDLPDRELGELELDDLTQMSTAKAVEPLPVKGHVGVGVTGAEGAIDRITYEILVSLEERETLVVWLFDQSGSLTRQREEIRDRFDRIYSQLGTIESNGNSAFSRHDEENPLLSSVVAFGERVNLLTPEPTADVEELKSAVDSIAMDESGVERVFTAVYTAAQEYQDLRRVRSRTREPDRNVLMVVVSDEAGDDQEGLEDTVQLCRSLEIPVFVIGVPAPFGRAETLVKWVDPDPEYDQSPQWGRVSQGPESVVPERIKLHFAGTDEQTAPIDSGFGPFALTRLCYETGGAYFTVHPNRESQRVVRRRDVEPYSAYIQHFFDPNTMRRYRPDYVSQEEYWRQVSQSKSRSALIQAAQRSWVSQLEPPQLRFERLDEATFINEVTQAQRASAILEPRVNEIFAILKAGEPDRIQEHSARWQAGFDLAMGRVLAVKARTEAYNSMLAAAKRGMAFSEERNNTWELVPSDEVNGGSRIERTASEARRYLENVVNDHAGTPWALLAQRELDTPLGWEWTEDFTAPPAPQRPRAAGNNNNNPPPAARDDRAMEIERPKERRPPPRL